MERALAQPLGREQGVARGQLRRGRLLRDVVIREGMAGNGVRGERLRAQGPGAVVPVGAQQRAAVDVVFVRGGAEVREGGGAFVVGADDGREGLARLAGFAPRATQHLLCRTDGDLVGEERHADAHQRRAHRQASPSGAPPQPPDAIGRPQPQQRRKRVEIANTVDQVVQDAVADPQLRHLQGVMPQEDEEDEPLLAGEGHRPNAQRHHRVGDHREGRVEAVAPESPHVAHAAPPPKIRRNAPAIWPEGNHTPVHDHVSQQPGWSITA